MVAHASVAMTAADAAKGRIAKAESAPTGSAKSPCAATVSSTVTRPISIAVARAQLALTVSAASSRKIVRRRSARIRSARPQFVMIRFKMARKRVWIAVACARVVIRAEPAS